MQDRGNPQMPASSQAAAVMNRDEDSLDGKPAAAVATPPSLTDLGNASMASVIAKPAPIGRRLTLNHSSNSLILQGFSSNPFRIGLAVCDYDAEDPLIAAIASPLSRCRVTSLVVLRHGATKSDKEEDEETQRQRAMDWLARYRVNTDNDVVVALGDDGFESMLHSEQVDAVYVIVPYDKGMHDYGMRALAANKHVLLKDPISTSLSDFGQELDCAQRHGKFVQFSSMFVHHFRVQTFLNCVLRKELFGSIESIDAKLFIAYQDAPKVGVTLPLSKGQGCIQHVGRFCVLLSVLMFSRSGSQPLSAVVQSAQLTSPGGEPVSAQCVVHFSQNRQLSFDVGYVPGLTRQVLDVRAHDRYATMTDFVIPHPDGLSTYRVYKKALNQHSGKLEVVSGEAMDVPSGVKEDVLLWKRFRELCRSVDTDGWEHAKQGEVQELTNVALMTKRVLMALRESLRNDFAEVPVPHDDRI